jgi:hypothetical protein
LSNTNDSTSVVKIERISIRPATLIQHHKLGFKIVPLSANHEVVMSWTPIYENPNFWSPERLVSESSKFTNVGTVFGKTHVKDEQGFELYLNGFDIDSEYVYHILNSVRIEDSVIKSKVQDLIYKTGSRSILDFLKQITVVVKTRKKFGFHIYWFSHKQNCRIRIEDCVREREFEIKTDKGSGHSTLPTSTHRNDPKFKYSHIGKQDKIAIINELYDFLVELLSACLIKNNNNKSNPDRHSNKIKRFANFYQNNQLILRDDQIQDSVSLLLDFYQEGRRDSFAFEFSGFAFKQNIAEESVIQIMKELCIRTNDLEIESRLNVIRRTYVNGVNGSEISGSSGLTKVIASDSAEGLGQPGKIIESILDIWYRYEIPLDSLSLGKISSLGDEQLDKIKIRSEEIAFCIDTILKEAPNEQIAVRQLFIGLCSSATHLPQNIGVLTQSGAGKNYMINKIISKFPQNDIIVLSNMTPKALFHDQGISAVKNPETNEYENLDEKIDPIDIDIEDKREDLENVKDKQGKKELRKEIESLQRKKKSLYSNAIKLIDLDGKVLVLLDTPDHNLLTNIAPILSHDRYEQAYKYVESNSGPIKTKVNVIRGFPTLFYSQASDRSDEKRFVEVSRRFLSISVNTSEKKVTDAIAQKVERAGGARGEYDVKIVDKAFVYRVKLILAVLMRKLKRLSRPYKLQLIEDRTLKLEDIGSGTFIPFKETLKIGLPHKHVLDMTAAETFNTYLTLLAKINADSRPKLIYSDGVVMPIATFEDLAVAMSLLCDSNNPGLNPELQNWYQEVFMEVYNAKVGKQKDREKQDNQFEEKEVGIKTADLIKKHKELSQSDKTKGGYKEENSKEILQRYLYPLINAGYVEDEKVEGEKAKLYRPVKDLKYSFYSFSDKKNIFPYEVKMKVEDSKLFPTKKTLELQISESLEYSSKYEEKENINFKLVDVDGNEISTKQLVDRYFSNPEMYFLDTGAQKEIEMLLRI